MIGRKVRPLRRCGKNVLGVTRKYGATSHSEELATKNLAAGWLQLRRICVRPSTGEILRSAQDDLL
ncbi:MAG: hypothetical protein VB860_02100 [Dehalococcoidia bacterium]|jgi:hypothetical protein